MGFNFERTQLEEGVRLRTQRSVARALQSCDSLVRLSDSLLDVARAQEGPLWLSIEQSDLVYIATEVMDRLKETAEHKRCPMTLTSPPTLIGRWDAVRLGEVFNNLLINALKYAPGTPIEITLRSEGKRVAIVVQDEGPGIAEEAQERVFHRFERAQAVMNSAGWGLGLHITRQIIAAHQGQIEISSEATQGCRVQIDLPLIAPSHLN